MQVQRFFSDQQMELRRRLEEMQYAERKKQQMIMKTQREKKKQMAIKREIVEQRIERNMELAAAVEEKRKNDFLDAQAKSEALRAEHLKKLEEERELKAQEAVLQEQRKRMILLQQLRCFISSNLKYPFNLLLCCLGLKNKRKRDYFIDLKKKRSMWSKFSCSDSMNWI